MPEAVRLLADASVHFGFVRVARAAGHDVGSIAETTPEASDEEVIRRALFEERTVLTEDRDFGRLVFAAGVAHRGIVYLRYPPAGRRVLEDRLLQLLANPPAAISRAFVTIQPGRTRVHALP